MVNIPLIGTASHLQEREEQIPPGIKGLRKAVAVWLLRLEFGVVKFSKKKVSHFSTQNVL